MYVINRLPSQVIYNVSPFERLYGTSPSYSNLKVFGCACFVYYYVLMNIPNLNHVHVYVVSWVMVLNIKDFVVGIPSLNDYAYHVMSPFGNIVCFLVFLHFMHLSLVFIHSSLILLLIYFPHLPHHLKPHIVHYPYLSSLNLILFMHSRIFHLLQLRNLNLHQSDGLLG